METKHIVRPALGALGILLVPFMLMQFGVMLYDPGSGYETLNWTLSDFVVMGVMLFVAGLLLELAFAKAGKGRFIAAGVILFLFLWLWAELAVGIFTNWGS